MKIEISEKGVLLIDGVAKFCPFSENSFCGAWCALFSVELGALTVEVSLCQKTWSCVNLPGNFKDSRLPEVIS